MWFKKKEKKKKIELIKWEDPILQCYSDYLKENGTDEEFINDLVSRFYG